MSDLSVQTFLRSGGTLADLTAKYSIAVRRHPEWPELVLLKYDQIASAMGESIVQDCRGLILDESNDWALVSLAFRKFFNHGEGNAAAIDWSTARVQEKLDGSLCVVYWWKGAWRVATSGTPDAGGNVGNGHIARKFSDLFWSTFKDMGLPLPTDTALCYAFELTAPENRVVVRHLDRRLTLIGVRDVDANREVPVEDFAHLFPVVQSFPLQSFADVTETFRTMNPLAQEGYVVVDADFNRVKVKHPGYVALHHMRDGFGPRRIVEVIRSGESDEVLAAFPEFEADMRATFAAFGSLVQEIEADYARLAHIPVDGPASQKAFALEATKSRVSGYLFQRRNGRVKDAREYLATMQINTLMTVLGLKDTPVAEVA